LATRETETFFIRPAGDQNQKVLAKLAQVSVAELGHGDVSITGKNQVKTFNVTNHPFHAYGIAKGVDSNGHKILPFMGLKKTLTDRVGKILIRSPIGRIV
jgi:hypothetical protein